MCAFAWLARRRKHRFSRVVLLRFAVTTSDGCTFIGDFQMSKLSQLGVVLALLAVTAAGAHVDIPDGATPSWSFSGDASVATLTPSADGKSATLVGNGAAGVVSVAVTVGGFTKTDSFEFEAAAPAPSPAPAPAPAPADPIVAIDWTVTEITAAAPASAPPPSVPVAS